MKTVISPRSHASSRALRSRLLLSACLTLSWPAWNWAGVSEADPDPKAFGPRTSGPLPPAEQRSFAKPDFTDAALSAMPDKFDGPKAGGQVAPGQGRALDKTASLNSLDAAGDTEKVPVNPATGPVPPAERRSFDKSALAHPEALPDGVKTMPPGQVSGPVPLLEQRSHPARQHPAPTTPSWSWVKTILRSIGLPSN